MPPTIIGIISKTHWKLSGIIFSDTFKSIEIVYKDCSMIMFEFNIHHPSPTIGIYSLKNKMRGINFIFVQ